MKLWISSCNLKSNEYIKDEIDCYKKSMREKLLASFKEITSKQKVNRLFKKKLESDRRSRKWTMTRIRDRLKSYLYDLKEKDLAKLKLCTIDQRKAAFMVRITQQLCVESWRRKISKSTNNKREWITSIWFIIFQVS